MSGDLTQSCHRHNSPAP